MDDDLLKRYLDWKATYTARAGICYKPWLQKFQKFNHGKLITENLDEFIRWKKLIEERFAPKTIQLAVTAIKDFYNFVRDEGIKCIPSKRIRIPIARARSHRALRPDEFHRIVSIIPENDFFSLRNKLMIWMLWDTGVRVSELLSINLSQINTDSRGLVLATLKTDKNRQIRWSEETQRLLVRYLPIRNELRNCPALFIGRDNKNGGMSLRLNRRSVERILKDYAIDAGIKERVTPHCCRHGWAHLRRDQGAQLTWVQKGLGHKNAISTMIYEQYVDKDWEKEAEKYLNVKTH